MPGESRQSCQEYSTITRGRIPRHASGLNAESVPANETGCSAPQFFGTGSRTWTNGTDRRGCKFRARTGCTKNVDRTAIATAPTTRVDARGSAAGHDALTLAPAAEPKAASLVGRAIRVRFATYNLVGSTGSISARMRLCSGFRGHKKHTNDQPQACRSQANLFHSI